MPRHVRNAEREFPRECFDDGGSVRTECRQRSGRAAELHDENSRRSLIQSLEVSDQWRRPDRAFEAKGGRYGVLKMGASGHRRVAKARGSIGETAREREEVAAHQRKRALQLQYERGVQDVLGGRAKMNPARRFVARDSAKFLDQRDHRIADAPCAVRDVVEPQVFDSARARDRIGDWRRNQAERGFGASQCGLDIQHELQVSVVGKQRTDFVGAIKRAENLRVSGIDAHTSKNTVSFSPCSTMSKPTTPGRSIRATSVARRSGATAFSTASVALSGSSGK